MPEGVQDTQDKTEVSDASLAGGGLQLFSRLRSYLVYDPLIWLYTIVIGTISLTSSFFDRTGEVQHYWSQVWAKLILWTLGIRVEVIGLDKIDTSKSHVYAVNHLSAVDVPALYATLPFQFRILAKRELFRYPFMGWHLKRSGQIPVDLDNARNSVKSLNKAVAALKSNLPLVIFPEGGRSDDGQLQKFLGGAFFAAIRSQIDIVPVALVGTFEILKMNTWHIKPRPVQLVFGQPISTQGLTLRDMDSLTARTREVIANMYYSRCEVKDLRMEGPPVDDRNGTSTRQGPSK